MAGPAAQRAVRTYSDVILPRFGIPALAAAILERRTSGLGQHIDISQVEAAIQFLAPAVLDEAVNGRTMGLAGLHSATACPNGVYRTAGSERFVAISVESTPQWRALLDAVPSLDAFGGAAFDAMEARRAVMGDIDARLAEWAATLPAPEVEARLVTAGVPASMVQRMTDLHADPQLRARGFFVPLQHKVMGEMPYDGLATRFSAKRQPMHRAGPVIGEHTEFVLRDLLRLSDDEIAEAAAADALT